MERVIPSNLNPNTFSGYIQNAVKRVKSSPELSVLFTRCILFSSGSICGTVVALHQCGTLSIGRVAPFLTSCRDRLFLFGSLFNLQYCCRKLYCILPILTSATGEERQIALRSFTSSLLGIISSLLGLFMSMAAIVGASTATIIVFGLIASMTSCWQILYDAMLI